MSNINKYTTKEVLNKVLLDSSGDAVNAYSHTSQEALNTALDATNNRLNVSLKGGTISGDVTIAGDLTVNGGGSMAYSEVLTGDMAITNTSATVGLTVNQSGAAYAISVNQDANSPAIYIDTEATSQHGIHIASPAITSGTCLNVSSANSLVDGRAAYFHSNSSNSTARDLVMIYNQNASATGTTGLLIRNDSTGNPLHIENTGQTSIEGLKLQNTQNSYAQEIGIGFYSHTTYTAGEIKGRRGGSDQSYSLIFSTTSNFDGDNMAEAMRIDGSGNVGIGTASPDTILNLVDSGGSTATNMRIKTFSDTTGVTSTLHFDKSHNDTVGTLTTTTDGSYLGLIEFRGVDSGGNVDDGAYIAAIQSGSASTRIPTKLQFACYSDSAEKIPFVIDSNSRISLSNNDSGAGNTIFGYKAGAAISGGGNSNLLIGYEAGNDLTTADGNVVLGYQAFNQATDDCDQNVVVGNYSMGGNIASNDVSNCVALGYNVMSGVLTSTASGTVGIGSGALVSLTSGTGNIAIGFNSGYNLTTNAENTYLGYESGASAGGNVHNYNTGVGYRSLKAVTTGSSNTSIGHNSMLSVTAGQRNVAVGYGTLDALTNNSADTANGNIAVGYNSLSTLQTGAANIAIGTDALYSANGAVSSCTVIGTRAGDAINSTDADGTVLIGSRAGTALTSGQRSTAVGYYALANCDDGDNNTAIGWEALEANCGDSNTALGAMALKACTGASNVAVGENALVTQANASAVGNVAVGVSALKDMNGAHTNNIAIGLAAIENASTATTFTNNIAIGAYAFDDSGSNDQTGTIAIGGNALTALTSGAYNIAIGYHSMDEHTTGRANTCLGWGTMSQSGGDTTAQDNTFIGASSGSGDWAGAGVDQNTAVGYSTMTGAMTGSNHNSAFGVHSLEALTTGDNNTALGGYAANAVTDGHNNVAIGNNSLKTSTSVGYAIAIGESAVANGDVTADADGAIGIGKGALYALTTGSQNVAVGYEAMQAQTTGHSNVAVGYQSQLLANNNAADGNVSVGNFTLDGFGDVAVHSLTAIGHAALSGSLTAGAIGSTAVGRDALNSLTSGAGNTAVGYQALDATTTGNYNTVVGYQAATALPAGANTNTAIGYQSLTAGNNASTDHNTCVGYASGDVITSGHSCTIIGSGADPGGATNTNETVIGYDATGQGSNSVTLGNASVTAVYMGEDGATGDGATVYGKDFVFAQNSGGGKPNGLLVNHVADAEGATFQFRKSRNTTVGSHTIVQNNDQLGNLAWYASDGNSWEQAAIIRCLIDGTPGDGDLPTEMLFGVAEDGNATPTIRMTMAPAGTISGDFNDTSDVGLKENIKSISDGLGIVKQMNPVSFDWKQKSRGSNSGFIAQEIEKLLPNDVNGKDYITPKDGEDAENMGKSINVTGIVAHLVKAVQELTAKVEALEAK